MDTKLLDRAKALLERGEALESRITRSERHGASYWYGDDAKTDARAWVDSVLNLFHLVTTPDMHFHQQVIDVSKDPELSRDVPFWVVQKLRGSLSSLIEEIELGLLLRAEYKFSADVFDDFLDHAEQFHQGGKKMESGVLSSIVFEDTLKNCLQAPTR